MKIELTISEVNTVLAALSGLVEKIREQAIAQAPAPAPAEPAENASE